MSAELTSSVARWMLALCLVSAWTGCGPSATSDPPADALGDSSVHDGGALGGEASAAWHDGTVSGSPETLGETGAKGGTDVSLSVNDSAFDRSRACSRSTWQVPHVTPKLLFLLDRSQSMGWSTEGDPLPVPHPDSKWSQTTHALTDFLADEPDDVAVGLTLFPTEVDPGACLPENFVTPDVAVGPLASTRQQIACLLGTAVDMTRCDRQAPIPEGLTPMLGALTGGMRSAQSAAGQAAHLVILVTDGDPDPVSCGDVDQVVDVAARGQTTEGTSTPIYVVGAPGGTTRNLSRIAFAGGGRRFNGCVADTNDPSLSCHYAVGGRGLSSALREALADIAGKAVSCRIPLATPPTRWPADGSDLDVTLTASGNSFEIRHDPRRADGWAAVELTPEASSKGPVEIELFGSACSYFRRDPAAFVVVLGSCAAGDGAPLEVGPRCLELGERCEPKPSDRGCCPPLRCQPSATGATTCHNTLG